MESTETLNVAVVPDSVSGRFAVVPRASADPGAVRAPEPSAALAAAGAFEVDAAAGSPVAASGVAVWVTVTVGAGCADRASFAARLQEASSTLGSSRAVAVRACLVFTGDSSKGVG
jgi:hypothetical protein